MRTLEICAREEDEENEKFVVGVERMVGGGAELSRARQDVDEETRGVRGTRGVFERRHRSRARVVVDDGAVTRDA